MVPASVRTALEVADWRARVFTLYAAVRAEADPEVAHDLWRIQRNELLAHHPASPLLPKHRARFRRVPIARYDPDRRFELAIEPAGPGGFEFFTGTDGMVPFERLGMVRISGAGSLDVWRLTTYGGGLFLPLRDALAGHPGGTYGGGRYLIDTIKGADLGADAAAGTLVVDLNFAYNLSCAYDPAWARPLAPQGNVLPVAVPVGELFGEARVGLASMSHLGRFVLLSDSCAGLVPLARCAVWATLTGLSGVESDRPFRMSSVWFAVAGSKGTRVVGSMGGRSTRVLVGVVRRTAPPVRRPSPPTQPMATATTRCRHHQHHHHRGVPTTRPLGPSPEPGPPGMSPLFCGFRRERYVRHESYSVNPFAPHERPRKFKNCRGSGRFVEFLKKTSADGRAMNDATLIKRRRRRQGVA